MKFLNEKCLFFLEEQIKISYHNWVMPRRQIHNRATILDQLTSLTKLYFLTVENKAIHLMSIWVIQNSGIFFTRDLLGILSE